MSKKNSVKKFKSLHQLKVDKEKLRKEELEKKSIKVTNYL